MGHNIIDVFEYKLTKVDHKKLEQAIKALKILSEQWYEALELQYKDRLQCYKKSMRK